MRHARLLGLIVTAGTALAGTHSANAEVTWTLDQAAWTSQVGGPEAVTAIDFGTVPGGAILNEQFATQGLHFTDGDDWRTEVGLTPPAPGVIGGPILFPLNYPITMRFDQMLTGFSAMEFTGDFGVQLFHDSLLVGSATALGLPVNQVIGFVSDVSFNRVVVVGNMGTFNNLAAMGNISFAVPAPSALALLAVAALTHGTRRRPR